MCISFSTTKKQIACATEYKITSNVKSYYKSSDIFSGIGDQSNPSESIFLLICSKEETWRNVEKCNYSICCSTCQCSSQSSSGFRNIININ